MTGNARDAKRAVKGKLIALGGGSSRRVFVDRSAKYVYKVERGYYIGMNKLEHDTMSELRALGCPFIPPTSLFQIGEDTVLAMPYYEQSARSAGLEGPFFGMMNDIFPGDLTWDVGGDNLRVTRRGSYRISDLQYMSDYNKIGA